MRNLPKDPGLTYFVGKGRTRNTGALEVSCLEGPGDRSSQAENPHVHPRPEKPRAMSPPRLQRRAAPKRFCNVPVSALAILGLAMLTNAALAAPKQCRHIDSRKERNACYEQQRQDAKKKPAQPANMGNAIDQMKLENDRLTKRLQGICRGC